MVDSSATPDLYRVLQVHPSADQEIIEAAYRQLMKKHHPDVAGTDAELAAEHHQRAKLINQAHSVLRDPVQRRRYDATRTFSGYAPPPPQSRRSHASEPQGARGASDAPPAWQAAEAEAAEAAEVGTNGAVRGPFAAFGTALAAAYYLLPGPYEWEGRRQELLATCLIPPIGIAAFALATGRLAPWVGHSLGATLVAWGILFVLLLPSWSSLPRMAMASLPSVVLMSGLGNVVLRQASVPAWLAWVLVGFLSLVLSARLYLFAVLPTLAVCWVLARLS